MPYTLRGRECLPLTLATLSWQDGHNATAEPFEFQMIGSDALGLSNKVNWTDYSSAVAFGVLRPASTPARCLRAIGWDDTGATTGHFAGAPCELDNSDGTAALAAQLFKVSFQTSGPDGAWGYWHLYFVGDRPHDMGVDGYTPSFAADDPARSIRWDRTDIDTTRNLFCFPFSDYLTPIEGA